MLRFFVRNMTNNPTLVRTLTNKSITDNSILIPHVDLNLDNDDIVDKILQAARSGGPGFFYLVNHGVEQTVFDNAINESRRFYSQPLGKKLDISFTGYAGSPSDKSSKGYCHPGFEGSYTKDKTTDIRPENEIAGKQKNLRESLVFRYPELTNDERLYVKDYEEFISNLKENVKPISDIDTIGPAARRFFTLNQWPNENDLPNFRPVIEKYFEETTKIANKMFDLFLQALRIELNVSNDHHFFDYDTPMRTYNLAHYPPCFTGGLGISDHTDWELFTLLYPTTYPVGDDVTYNGLEIWHQGDWIRVPHIPGTIIVNQGEMLSRFSKGKFLPPVHRVDANHPRDRYSLVSFWAPNYETLLPDPSVPSKYVLSGEYYLKRNNLM